MHGKDGRDFPFWLLTSRSMQYSWGSNVSLPILADVARHVRGHFGIMLNRGAARRAEGLLDEREQPHCDQGMTAEVEKVVAGPAGPDASRAQLELAA